MSCGNVIDMDKVESGINERRHTAGRGLDNNAPGGRGFHIARTDRGRRVDDNHRQAVLDDHGFHDPLGRNLAALVAADGLCLGKGRRFICWRANLRGLSVATLEV